MQVLDRPKAEEESEEDIPAEDEMDEVAEE